MSDYPFKNKDKKKKKQSSGVKKKQKGTTLFASKSEKQLSRVNMYKQISNAFFKYTGKKAHPHMLRHFFVTEKIVEEGKDIKSISQYVGHSNIILHLIFILPVY